MRQSEAARIHSDLDLFELFNQVVQSPTTFKPSPSTSLASGTR